MSPVTETSRLEKEYFCLSIIMEGFFYCLSGLNPNTSIALAKHFISAAKLVMYGNFNLLIFLLCLQEKSCVELQNVGYIFCF